MNGGGDNNNQDQNNLDDFLASHGFEFIDGEREESRPIREQDDVSDLDGTGTSAQAVGSVAKISLASFQMSQASRASLMR